MKLLSLLGGGAPANRLPTPTCLMANLIALRIAALPADPHAPYKGQGHEEIKLHDGRIVYVGIHEDSLDDDMSGSNAWRQVEIQLQGEPRILLSENESWPIINQLRQYRARSIKASKIEAEKRAQEAALNIVEGLIG